MNSQRDDCHNQPRWTEGLVIAVCLWLADRDDADTDAHYFAHVLVTFYDTHADSKSRFT